MIDTMQRIHQFISDTTAQGHTVLVYKRQSPVKHLTDMSQVTMVGGVVFVDGVNVKGWTIARKP